MLPFVSTNLFPRRESREEGPAFDYEANAAEERDPWVIGAPKSTRKRIGIARWRGRGSEFGGDRGWSRSHDVRRRGKIAAQRE